jgi:hypothetical protein
MNKKDSKSIEELRKEGRAYYEYEKMVEENKRHIRTHPVCILCTAYKDCILLKEGRTVECGGTIRR